MTHRVTLIPGDGIGPEVTAAGRRALEATGVEIDWDVQEAGAATHEREGIALPDPVIDSIRERGAALKGPTATPSGSGFRSVNLTLREALDLYAGVRPCRALAGAQTRFPEVDLVIVRMNSEDLYAGIEYEPGDPATERLRAFVRETRSRELPQDTGLGLKPISAAAARRVVQRAFEYARATGRSRVTAVHKASVMRFTDGLFLEVAREVAGQYPEISFDDELVDTVCQRLVVEPGDYDVLVTPMLYGDILSDLGAGLIGGLGLAPGANLGDGCAVFEAVHGSAPRHAGRNRANPIALILSGAMLLEHLGEADSARRLRAATAQVVREGRAVSYDLRPGRELAGATGTAEMADAIIAALEHPVEA